MALKKGRTEVIEEKNGGFLLLVIIGMNHGQKNTTKAIYFNERMEHQFVLSD